MLADDAGQHIRQEGGGSNEDQVEVLVASSVVQSKARSRVLVVTTQPSALLTFLCSDDDAPLGKDQLRRVKLRPHDRLR